jgi:hypothetical protein
LVGALDRRLETWVATIVEVGRDVYTKKPLPDSGEVFRNAYRA